MSDLIYRSHALNAINMSLTINSAWMSVAELPSAQPEPCEDAVSREAVIAKLKDMRKHGDMIPWEGKRVFEAIRHLPSAQPERPEQPESAKEYCAECNHIEMCRWYPYEGCEFRSLPSAQPQQKKGRWIHDGYDNPHGVDWMHCSVCGRREPHVPAAMTNFCPSCGADMRGESDED